MKCKCGSNHWFIHDEASGIGIKTCLNCGWEGTIPTEWEVSLGIPVKSTGYNHLNRIGVIRKLGMTSIKKAQYFEAHKKEMIRVWRKKGDFGVVTTFPIHISTWVQYKKKWGLVPAIDNRIISGQYSKPTRSYGRTMGE